MKRALALAACLATLPLGAATAAPGAPASAPATPTKSAAAAPMVKPATELAKPAGGTVTPARARVPHANATSAQGAKFGIAPVSTTLAEGGYLVYFRYRVTDPKKAEALFHDGINPAVYDRASKQQLDMPRDTKLGGLRSSPRSKPEVGKLYYVLFGNPTRAVHKGSHIDVSIGDCKLSDLVVE